jgi:hypothetical protein
MTTLCTPAAALPVPVQRRRRRKGLVGDLNVALYIKQQQARGSTRKWRQQWYVACVCVCISGAAVFTPQQSVVAVTGDGKQQEQWSNSSVGIHAQSANTCGSHANSNDSSRLG